MKKVFFLSVLALLSFLNLIFGICMSIISNGEKYIFTVIMGILFCFLYIIWYTVFCINTNKYPKNTLKKIINKSDMRDKLNIDVIEKKRGYFDIFVNNKNISIELDDYIFRYDYIIAFIIRQIRYIYVSKNKPIKYLFLHSYKLPAKNLNVVLTIKKYNGKNSKIIIIKNSKSKITFLQNIINKSKYYTYFYSNWSQSKYINKSVCIINEQIYQTGELKVL